jgi:hypothetical protein
MASTKLAKGATLHDSIVGRIASHFWLKSPDFFQLACSSVHSPGSTRCWRKGTTARPHVLRVTPVRRAVYAVRANLEQLLISLTSAEDDGTGFLSFSPRFLPHRSCRRRNRCRALPNARRSNLSFGASQCMSLSDLKADFLDEESSLTLELRDFTV